jgi:hypothetical protein
VSVEYLSRLSAGRPMSRIQLKVSAGDFEYVFD